MLWKTRAISFLLTLGVGALLLSAAPAYSESSGVSVTEVRVAKPAIRLKRIRYKAPEYPQKALQARLSGFVTIEFVVNAKGEPTALRIVDAVPAQIFEHAVLTAAKRWRYEPLLVDNMPAERPTRMIVRFESHT